MQQSALAIGLATLLLVMPSAATAQVLTLYVDAVAGNDSNSGLEASNAFKTFKHAVAKLKPGMTLSIAPATQTYREPILIRTSGEPDKPIIIEGNGVTIDLGTDVSDGPWKPDGDLWILDCDIEHPKNRAGLEQAAGLFIDDIPIYIPHPRQVGELKPGQMRFDDAGRAHVAFPAGKRPGACRVMRVKDPMGTSGVAIQASYVTVRNLTCRYAGNDGFNLHGTYKGVRLENIKAFFNGDEGISAHDKFEVEVIGAEVAHNGSVAGGIADVDDCVSIYRNCLIHHNRAAFFFQRGRHEIHDSVLLDNGTDIPKKLPPSLTLDNVVTVPQGVVPDVKQFPPSLRELIDRAASLRRDLKK